jgi:hypothetical protein
MWYVWGTGEVLTGFWWGDGRGWEDNIKMDLPEVGWGSNDWVAVG